MDTDDTATLLLGLSSGGAHAEVRASSAGSLKLTEGAALGPSPRCTPAVVAAALMSASQEHDVNVAGDPTKNRRLQVSALPRKEWSAEEDALIRSGVEQLGCRWRVIAAQLPGRSDDAVRNRWSRLQESLRGGGAGRRASSSNGVEDESSGQSSDAEATGRERGGDGGGAHGVNGAASGGRHSASSGGGDEATEAASKSTDSASTDKARDSGRTVVNGVAGAGYGTGNGCSSAACASGGGSGGGSRGGSTSKSGGGRASGGAAGGGGGKSGSRRASNEAGGTGNDSSGGAVEKKERTSWTRAEDDIIIQGVAELGHKWYEIARRLPGRTDHAIRNRWSRLQSIIGMQSVGAADAGATLASPRLAPSLAAGLEPSTSLMPPASVASELPHGSMALRLPLPPSQNSAVCLQVLSKTVADAPATAAAASVAPAVPGTDAPRGTAAPDLPLPPPHEAKATTLSMAALANVEQLHSVSDIGAIPINMNCAAQRHLKQSDGQTSGGTSEGSDAELTTGTAELLLLHSGGAPSSQPSPQITASSRSPDDCPEVGVGDPAQSSAVDLLLLTKRPRV